MALTYPAFASLDPVRLAALEAMLLSVIQTYNPQIDLRRGTVKDQVLHARALLTQVMEVAVLNALQSGSLTAIVANPSIADADAVDRILGNFRLTRQAGSNATGKVAIVLSSLTAVVIAQGALFTINGVTFATDQTYAARTSQGAVVGPGDRLLVAIAGGNYMFDVNVVATAIGVAGNVRSGATATPSQPPNKFVRAYADGDFFGGSDADTNASLVSKLQSGLACQAWSDRPTIEAVIRAQAAYVNFQKLSIVGFLDPEMLRDQHSIWPVSGGGRADMYVRSGTTYSTVRITKQATLLSVLGTVGTWQLGIGKDDAPGYYEIVKFLLVGSDVTSNGFLVATETRSLDLTAPGWHPDLVVALEGVYSRYQASVVTFADTTTNASLLTPGVSKANYDVILTLMPQLDSLQDFWNDSAHRPTMGDVLVKGAIPCFTGVTFTLNVVTGTTVDTDAVATAIASTINASGFSGNLTASLLTSVLHSMVPGLVSITNFGMSGRLRKPNGTQVYLNDTDILTIPNDYVNMTSGRTAAFLSDASLIGVTVATVAAPGA